MADKKSVEFTVRAKDAFSAVLKSAENGVEGFGKKLFSLKGILASLGPALAGLSIGVLVKDLVDLGVASEKAFRQIAANLPTGVQGIGLLKKQMTDLAVSAGHALDEVQAAGIEIAKLGVSNAAEVMERLSAAMEVSDATGTDLTETIHGLDQIMDAFGLSSAQAEEQLAKLVSAAKGRTDIQSVFEAFQKSAPIFQKLGIDADTATKAIVGLLDRGFSGKQVGATIAKYEENAAAIRTLAKDAKISTTALDDLRKAADLVRTSTANTAQGLRTQFAAALTEVGTNALPLINGGLEVLNFWLTAITHQLPKVKLDEFIAKAKEAGALSIGGRSNLAPGSSGAIGLSDALGNLNTQARKGALDPARFTAQEAEQIRQSIETSVRLAQEYWAQNHRGLAMSEEQVKNLRASYSDLIRVLDVAATKKTAAAPGGAPGALPQTDEERKKLAEAAKKEAEAADRMAEASRKLDVARAQLAAGLKENADELLAGLTSAYNELTGNLLPNVLHKIDEQHKATVRLIEGNTELTASARAQALAREDVNHGLARQKAITDQLISDAKLLPAQSHEDLADLNDMLGRLQERVKLGGDTRDLEAEILQIQKEIADVTGESGNTAAKQLKTDKERVEALAAQARNIEAAARGALQLAEAFGIVDQRTAAALENVVQIAANIPGALSGDLGSILSVAGGVASIVSNFFGASKAQKEAAERLHEATVAFVKKEGAYSSTGNPAKEALQGLRDELESLLAEARKVYGPGEQYNTAAQRLGTTEREKEAQVAVDFWDSITRALNEADGPAGAYRNRINDINKAHTEAQQSAITLGASTEQLAEIERLYVLQLTQAAEAEARRVQAIDSSLDLRELEAQGRSEEADALRRQLEEEGQLHDAEMEGWSEEQIARLLYIQGLEDQATAQQKAADAARELTQALEEQISTGDEILGHTPAQTAQELAGTYGFDLGDISTQAGVDAAIATLQNLYNANTGDKELARRILNTIRSLRRIDFGDAGTGGGAGTGPAPDLSGTTSAVSSGFQAITTTEARGLLDIGKTHTRLLTDIRTDIHAIYLRTPQLAPMINLPPPGGGSGGSASGGGGGASVSLTINGGVQVNAPSASPKQLAKSFVEEVGQQVNEVLGQQVVQENLYRGNVSVSTSRAFR